MIGTPRLLTTLRDAEPCRQGIKCLEAQFAFHLTFIFREYLLTELIFKVLTDDPYYLAKASLDGIVDGIVHDGLTVGAQTVELLQAAVTASHACC